MRLTTCATDLQDAVSASLDARLLTTADHPVAIGLSGGGDSLALLLFARAWAARHDRRLLVLTVDHQLQPQSRDWTQACAGLAERLGHAFMALAWTGEKPTHGLPAAARAARHRLLAEAARDKGARVILLGHTADDVAEARAMRAVGSTTPDPREWSPSPAWPQGRGIFLLRPMLPLRRNDLRRWLASQGEGWIDDPANSDLAFARPRARAQMNPGDDIEPDAGQDPHPARILAEAAVVDAGGMIAIDRTQLRAASPRARLAFIGAACLCAAGTTRPPRGLRLARLEGLIAGEGPITATLCGARIEADPDAVRFLREPGEAERGNLGGVALPKGRAIVWDGRFAITARAEGLYVKPLAGDLSRLDDTARKALRMWPAKARAGFPGLFEGAGLLGCPLISVLPQVEIRALAGERLLAACGAIDREPAVGATES